MAIPLSLLTIQVQRSTPIASDDDIADGYDAAGAAVIVASGVRAVIGQPSASVVLAGGDRVVFSATFNSDPCDIQPGDTVVASDGTRWIALWSRFSGGFGLDHQEGELRLVQGAD